MIPDITITSLETITVFDILTGNYKFTMDELQNVTIQNGEEKTDITGRAGRKLSSLKKNKTVTISGTNGLISHGMMEAQTGGAFEEKDAIVKWADYLTVSGNAATTLYTAVGTEGNEIPEIFVKNTDGTQGARLTQDSAVSAGKFTYDPATKAIAFAEGEIKDGTEIIVYYNRKIKADVLENNSNNYSSKCMMYIDAMAEDKCSNVYRVQIFIPKADFNGEFSIEFGDNQAVHAFEAEGLAGACGTGGALWTYTVFGVNTEDAA